MTKSSEHFLISKIILYDDHASFEVLIEKYQGGVRNLLLKLVDFNQDELNDLTQETFIKVYKNIKSFKGKSAFSTWIYRLTYNTFLDWNAKKRRYGKMKEERNLLLQEPRNQEDATENRIDAEILIACLKPEGKVAFQLSYIEGFSHKENAQILNCPLGTVKSYLLRGKERIRKSFKLK